MIDEMRLQNFKCFAAERVRFSNLTLLAGANASGKSTVIQAMLLLRQSHLRGNLARGDLVLAGALANVGTAGDALTQGADLDDVIFELTESSVTDRFAFRYETAKKASYILSAGQPLSYRDGVNLFDSRFNYLNAERVGPRLLYPMDELRRGDFDVGTHGEFAAQVLARRRDEQIACEPLAYRDEAAREMSLLLGAQTRYWMQTLIPDFDIELSELTSADQIRVTLKTGTREFVRPTNIGFGIIYTLPIVVAALVAPSGSLLIVENPEAHLHPASQSRMGLFLARVAAAGIQIIVETHSDHVLNGIRRAVRQKTLEPAQVSLLFFSGSKGVSRVEPLKIYPSGGIDPRPEGFFDQTEKDLMELF